MNSPIKTYIINIITQKRSAIMGIPGYSVIRKLIEKYSQPIKQNSKTEGESYMRAYSSLRQYFSYNIASIIMNYVGGNPPPSFLQYAHREEQGIRPTMEDEIAILDNVLLNPQKLNGISNRISLFCVFDGHGGKKCSEYTKENLCPNIIQNLENGETPESALTKAFLKTDLEFIKMCEDNTSGTTANVLLFDLVNNVYWDANTGDSRSILIRKNDVIPLSVDHKPDRPDEFDRVKKAGGFVIRKRVMGELAVSRAIGDKDFKADDLKLVIADPEIKSRTLNLDEDLFIVVACDGLFDVLTNEKIREYIMEKKNLSIDQIASDIVTHAIDTLYTRDNVSVIIIGFNQNNSETMNDINK